MKKILILGVIYFFSTIYAKTHYISNSADFDSTMLTAGDSILFRHGVRYFTHINLFKDTPDNLYFGSFGDTFLPKPVLDGSIYHFDFNAAEWKDSEVIKGVKFYKKSIKGLVEPENIYTGTDALTLAREPDENETVIKGQKNSYAGYFQIDSVDIKQPKKVFYDFDNKSDWTGAEVITKTQQWSYEVMKIKNDRFRYETEENTDDAFKKLNGYFIQRHFSALDSQGEWFYNEQKGILYFSPNKEKCTIYVSSNRNDNNSGFDIRNKKNIRIENIEFRNYKHGLYLENAKNITVKNCSFWNCIYGVLNTKTYLENIKIENNSFRNMKSYGIRLITNNSLINKNDIDSVGLSMSCESKGFNNLNGIEIYGKNNIISRNSVKNTGYCGIRFFNCSGSMVINNNVENTMLLMSDGGGIYTYHSSEGNKLIKGNTVINAYGNAAGSPGKSNGASGIYLDELSMNFKVDSNFVEDCGTGIYLQNSTKDTITNNVTGGNRDYELHFNSAGMILNGGRLNPSNDPAFDPETLSNIPPDYIFDRQNRTIKYKKNNKFVYVEPGGNEINNNRFNPDPNKYTFCFRTWRHINNNIFKDMTGCEDFFKSNVPERAMTAASVYIIGGNVKDMSKKGKNFDNIKNTFDKTKFSFLRKIFIFIGRGQKPDIKQ
ncbi:TPA: hypothetical protein DCR49_09870 [Candidatus Delongbacteria bacterium]|nr:hypothetical protein [Candidatus Delongbacteria bacterium]